MMKTKYCFLLLTIISVFGCASRKFYASTFPANPTAYVFPIRIDSVGKVFKKYYFKHHNDLNFGLEGISFQGDGYSKSHWEDLMKEYPSLPGEENKYDIWMRLTTDSSTVYYGKNSRKPEYTMECKAHCEAVDSNHTKMSIQVYSAKINVGTEWLPSPPHFVNNSIYREVKPTTVEAYKILLCFGRGLGIDKQMPALKTN